MIEYINYKKKKLPVRIQFYALMKFKAETGKSFDEMKEIAKEDDTKTVMESLGLDEFGLMEPLLYYSLISGHKAITPEKEFPFIRENAFDILEECFLEFVDLLPKFFPAEEEIKKTVTGADDDGKKQLTNRQPKKTKRNKNR